MTARYDFVLEGFCARVRAAREDRGLTQAEIANALGIGGEAYRAYEKRTPLPHFLIERFARITLVEIEYLFTGRRLLPQPYRLVLDEHALFQLITRKILRVGPVELVLADIPWPTMLDILSHAAGRPPDPPEARKNSRR